LGGVVIGVVSGVVCWYFATAVKQRFGYDDSLDVFGVHGIGGLLGTLLVSVFAAEAFGGLGDEMSIGSRFGVQALAAAITIVYTGIASFVLLKLTGMVLPLRVDVSEEQEGLDISLHEESGYNL